MQVIAEAMDFCSNQLLITESLISDLREVNIRKIKNNCNNDWKYLKIIFKSLLNLIIALLLFLKKIYQQEN